MSGSILYLASASPRRLELLRQISIEPHICVADIDETPHAEESAQQMAQRLALAKAMAVVIKLQKELSPAQQKITWALGADTTGIVENPFTSKTEILLKPESKAEAVQINA